MERETGFEPATLAGSPDLVSVVAPDSFDPSLVAAVRDAFPGCALMGSTSSAEMSSTSGFLEDSVSAGALRVRRYRYHGRPRPRARPGRRRRLSGRDRRGAFEERSGSEGLRRVRRPRHRRAAADPRRPRRRPAGRRRRRRGRIGPSRPGLGWALVAVLQRAGHERGRRGPPVLGTRRVFDRGRDRLAVTGRERGDRPAPLPGRSTRSMAARRSNSWPATSTSLVRRPSATRSPFGRSGPSSPTCAPSPGQRPHQGP